MDLLARNKEVEVHARGETISVRGQPSDHVYCIASGNTKVTRPVPRTRSQTIVRLAVAGEMLGYRCIFSEARFRSTSFAMTPTSVCRIRKEIIFGLIESNHAFARELLARMGAEISAAEDHHHSFCQKNVRERLAEALVLLKEKCGVQSDRGWLLDIRMSRLELGNWVGTAKESVVRCLSEFKDERLILQDGDAIILIELEKLRAIAGLPAADDR